MRGLVCAGSNNSFTVECEDAVVRRCTIKGKKIRASEARYNPLAPGDIVEIEADDFARDAGRISELHERRNEFVRWNTKGRKVQLLAANIDLLVCVTTVAHPPFRPRFIDRLLVQAESAHLVPLIVCNKGDLASGPDLACRLDNWRALGYHVLTVSARTGAGLDALAHHLAGKSAAFVGQSGVGKSSLVNAFSPVSAASPAGLQRTAGLSEKYERGVHTTTQGILLHCTSAAGERFAIIDTPGVRHFRLHGIASDELIVLFREMAGYAVRCQYGLSCTHTHEAGCAVIAAVQGGQILADRYESYLRLRDELREQERRQHS